jgi:predicted glycosyl hydrolase (DUF1957 family)
LGKEREEAEEVKVLKPLEANIIEEINRLAGQDMIEILSTLSEIAFQDLLSLVRAIPKSHDGQIIADMTANFQQMRDLLKDS